MNTVEKMILIPMDRYKRMQALLNEGSKELSVPHPLNDPSTESVHRVDQQGEGEPLDSEIIMASIPKQFRYKVKAILAYIQRDSYHLMNWNEKGELIYRGKVIQGSHISDFLKSTQRLYKSFTPVGETMFRHGLAELHVPVSLLGNQLRPMEASSSKQKLLETTPRPPVPPGIRHNPIRRRTVKWISI